MNEMPRLKVPLLQPSQAQKHVTVNEALALLDGLAQLVLLSRGLTAPPAPVIEGACYAVAAGATGDWAGEDGRIALGANGGWVFVTPETGWRAWVEDEGRELVHVSGDWTPRDLSRGTSGAAARLVTEEVEHVVAPGGAQDLAVSIPANCMVFAASSRVLEDLAGTATSWRLGSVGADDRFGSGLGTVAGSYGDGLLGQPTTYYSAEALRMSPESGTFSGGRIRVAIHYLVFDLPGA